MSFCACETPEYVCPCHRELYVLRAKLEHYAVALRECVATSRCGGSGEIVVGTRQDSFGNWDTEEHDCPGCPDCSEVCPNCGGDGHGEPLPSVGTYVPCGSCNGSGWVSTGG